MSQNFSAENSVTMILFPDGPCRGTGIANCEVKVIFLPCPDGFLLLGTKCMCDRRLTVFNATCYVDDRTILREENNFWMMAIYENSFYRGLLLHDSRCPFDFCAETALKILIFSVIITTLEFYVAHVKRNSALLLELYAASLAAIHTLL